MCQLFDVVVYVYVLYNGYKGGLNMGTLREILRAYRYTSSKHWEQFNELERLAKIGKAAEKAFKENSCILFIDSTPNARECFEYEFTNSQQLLEWAEKED